MKPLRSAWLILALLGASQSFGSYFSDLNEVRQNRILLGGGIRSQGLGLAYQRSLSDVWGFEGSFGLAPFEGVQGGLGGTAMWRQDRRFRPRVYAGLSWIGGMPPITMNLGTNGDTASTRFETASGLSAIVAGGFQFRVWRGLGANYDLGYRQSLFGGECKILSTTDEQVSKRVLDYMTGSGISFSGRMFWEF